MQSTHNITTLDALKAHLVAQTAEDKFSGVVLVAQDGEPIFQQAYGLASKRFNVPNRVDTKFNIGSINKLFTTVAVLQLAERGLLALDDPLGKFRPDFRPEVAEKVTVRLLLQHRAGFGHYWEHEAYRATWVALRKLEDYMTFIKDIPLEFEPGAREQYSNTGFEVLGAIIEAVTGESYYDYVRAQVYEPAGMTDTDAYETDLSVENLATGYTNHAPPGGEAIPGYGRENTFMHPVKGTAAGGGYSTTADLLSFDRALRQFKLLNPRYTALMFHRFNDAMTIPLQVVREFRVAGGADGINAFYGSRPARVGIVLSNFDPPTAMDVGGAIMDMPEGVA